MKKRIIASLLLTIGGIWFLILSAILMNHVDAVGNLLSVILDIRWLWQFVVSLSMLILGVFITNKR